MRQGLQTGKALPHELMKSLRQLIPYVKPYRWAAIFSVVTAFLMVASELVVPRLLQYLIDQGIRPADTHALIIGVLLILLAAFGGAVATLGQGYYRARLSQGIAFDMRNALFAHIQSLSFATLDEMQTGGLMTRISSDVDVIRTFASNGITLMLRAILMIVGSLTLVILTDLQLSTIMIAALFVAGVMIWVVMHVAQPMFMRVQQTLSAMNTVVQENLAGIRVVKAFVRESYEVDAFEQRSDDYTLENIQVGRILSVVMPTLTVLTNLGIVAVIWFGGLDVIDKRISLGGLVAFNNYLMIGMTPLLLLGNMLNMASRAEASAERVLEVFNTDPKIKPPASPYVPQQMRGQVTFDHVSFRYNTQENTPVLDDVSFTVQPGQTIALLGVTGSGKSILVNLIARFYDVTGGRVLIDGVDVRDWDPEALRSHIGNVPQHNTLFSGSIRDNIAYGKPNATPDAVITAAKAAQANDFILERPQAYDSMVEARGANLSGGQKQRVAIARALLIEPTILVLDDSTSAVDLETEIWIQEALDNWPHPMTTFIIAQRINSVLNADQIMILEGGHIVGQGTHTELLRDNPIYQEIYRSQFGSETLDETLATMRGEREQ